MTQPFDARAALQELERQFARPAVPSYPESEVTRGGQHGMKWKETELTGWGRVVRAKTLAARPERMSELPPLLSESGAAGLIAYGAGRSYGDSALNTNGRTWVTGRLDRILAFDETTGVVDVEPGITFRRLMDVVLPIGWLVRVRPGTGFA